jgi:hypothetical protein
MTDGVNDRVVKFDTYGAFVAEWSSWGEGEEADDLKTPVGIAVWGTHVYVTDAGNDRVVKFDTDGEYVTAFGSTGSGPGEFRFPNGIAVDSGNRLHVADSQHDRIAIFDQGGSYEAEFTGHLAFPAGVAVDPSTGAVYVADANNHVVRKFSGPRAQVIVHVYDPAADLYPRLDDFTFNVIDEASGTVTAYTYDENGSRSSKTAPGADPLEYSYDVNDRLVRVERRAVRINFQPSWTYVPAGYVADTGEAFGDSGTRSTTRWCGWTNRPIPARYGRSRSITARTTSRSPAATCGRRGRTTRRR